MKHSSWVAAAVFTGWIGLVLAAEAPKPALAPAAATAPAVAPTPPLVDPAAIDSALKSVIDDVEEGN